MTAEANISDHPSCQKIDCLFWEVRFSTTNLLVVYTAVDLQRLECKYFVPFVISALPVSLLRL